MNNNEFSINCPNCGKGFTLSVKANEENKESKPRHNKAAERIAALKAAGVDITDYFAVTDTSGRESVMRLIDGKPSFLADDDPIFLRIKNGGTIPERRLFRRWVMGQMFRHLESGNYTQSVHRLGYDYVWEQALEELRVQAVLYAHNDMENYKARNKWFNVGFAVNMSEEYIKALFEYVDSRKVKKCKGRPYKVISGTNIFLDEIEERIIAPVKKAKKALEMFEDAKCEWSADPKTLYYLFSDFNKTRTKLPKDTKQPSVWMEAYKGAGAYYTLRNMIMFHDCLLPKCRNEYESLKELETVTGRLGRWEGYKLLGLLKETIKYNNINITAKRLEWRAQKTNR